MLAVSVTNSVSAIDTGDIKKISPYNLSLHCTYGTNSGCRDVPMIDADFYRYNHFYTALASRAFDYDQGLLPEVAEVIFALRIKQANIGEEFVINLSGNYLLNFDKDKIYILDTYTKNSSVYKFRTANSNVTIGLSVSKGLPRNYKSITIKEDAYGQLYNYAALRSDNISTDEAILTETINHPFYEIAGKDGFEYRVEDRISISMAMAFYQTLSSHARYPRCIPSKGGIIDLLKDIFAPGVGCQPKAISDIHSANHNSVEEMRLDQQLVEAPFNTSKYKYGVGYRLRSGVDLHGQKYGENALAYLTSSLYCGVFVMRKVENSRHKRDISPDQAFNCVIWVARFINAFYEPHIIHALDGDFLLYKALLSGSITFYHFMKMIHDKIKVDMKDLKQIINEHGEEARYALLISAGVLGEAVMTDPGYRANYRTIADVLEAVAEGTPAIYEVSKEVFIPLPNEVYRVASIGGVRLVDGEHYTTDSISSADFDKKAEFEAKKKAQNKLHTYLQTINEWKTQFATMMNNVHAEANKLQMQFILNLTEAIYSYLSWMEKTDHASGVELVNVVYHSGVLMGVSVGLLREREYQTVAQLSSPQALTHKEGGYRGVLPFLESEVVKSLFSRHLIDKASIARIVRRGVPYPAEVDMHEEL